ncbi:thioredoxin reductase [Micromonospora siamensis]|uniref:Uncharacterized protein n=1 Tax=Micromonospora siamensis TaxID=299152 RepID=A0A1C5JTK7_9ACTN|nr:thioredoxin reductase [Micromonospora siamensis]SCG73823.1 hypothetical protein GA0074704_4958 [Micromonospora siamensis]
MVELRDKMITALAAADLAGPAREQVAAVCAEVAERHCQEFGHAPAVRSGEIGELADGEPALGWAPTEPGQRAW